ncbi:hypothetical protein F8388_014487 [Cannabis sativa]|uniref:Mechanosensitive ion channel MscS domain-containing protein n=1 Tax=Cannabis sativa TaxID=3483 RepID=A0A7J6FYI9_CANSA|nr:hypothetical protein F8388_014487 [Cannabis sativa]
MEVKEKASSNGKKPDNNGESILVDIPSVEAKEAKGSPSKVSESSKKASLMDFPEISRFRPSPNNPPATPSSPERKPESIVEAKEAKGSPSKVLELPKKASLMDSPEISSLIVKKLEKTIIWGLELWRWFVLIMVIFCGFSITNWFMHPIVFIIERIFSRRKKVLFFVDELKKSVQVLIWLDFILLTWVLVFNHGVPRSKTVTKILEYITLTLATLVIGTFLWLLKTLLLKISSSSFHVNTFFDRIQESIFHHYVLQTLLGPPSMGQLSFTSTKKGKKKEKTQVIDIAKLHRMKQEKVSAWTMKVLIDAVSSLGILMISNPFDEMENMGAEQHNFEITSEMEATAAAYHIFRNVAKPGSMYIDEDDLMRFMIREEVDLVLPLIGTENGRIDRKALTDWVVKAYNGRKALMHSLSDTKTAVTQLDKLVTVILVVVTIVIWLLLIKIDTTKVLVFFSSQIIVAAFVFGKDIVFVFIKHPFDVGDRCVIDGLVVEEMNILTTVFLKLNNEKVYYPNSILSTKPISNYYRSPDMGDSIEFSIDFKTSLETIGQLKQKIKKYIEKNPFHWHPAHNVVVLEIENVNKLKMALNVTHTINFQEFGEKNRRRTELVMEVKRIFEELNIKCCLQPETIHANPIGLDSDSNLVQI